MHRLQTSTRSLPHEVDHESEDVRGIKRETSISMCSTPPTFRSRLYESAAGELKHAKPKHVRYSERPAREQALCNFDLALSSSTLSLSLLIVLILHE